MDEVKRTSLGFWGLQEMNQLGVSQDQLNKVNFQLTLKTEPKYKIGDKVQVMFTWCDRPVKCIIKDVPLGIKTFYIVERENDRTNIAAFEQDIELISEVDHKVFWYDHLEYAKDDHVWYTIDGHKMSGIIEDYNSHCNMYIISTDRTYNAVYPKDIIDFFQNDSDVKEQDLEKLQDQLDRLFADLDDNSQGCNHNYKHYIGLTEVYDYCIKCDHKKL